MKSLKIATAALLVVVLAGTFAFRPKNHVFAVATQFQYNGTTPINSTNVLNPANWSPVSSISATHSNEIVAGIQILTTDPTQQATFVDDKGTLTTADDELKFASNSTLANAALDASGVSDASVNEILTEEDFAIYTTDQP